MTRIEKLTRDRSRTIVLMALTFALWQGGDIATKLLQAETDWFLYASFATVIGAVTYAGAALGLFIFQRRVKQANAGSTLNDDWARHIRGQSVQYGFVFLLVAIILMYSASLFWDLAANVVLQSLLLIGVVGTMLAYVWLERKGEGAE